MNSSITINKKVATAKALTIVIAIVAAVALPQIFHVIGAVSGAGTELGATFLPMHIPVLIAGFLGGPVVGIISGIISPIISFVLTGMPTAMLLPFIVIELAAYGLVAGLLSKVKMNSFLKLIIVQVAGRIVRAVATLSAIYLFGNTQLTVASIGAFITAGLFGIVLQLAFIPLFIDRAEGIKKLYE